MKLCLNIVLLILLAFSTVSAAMTEEEKIEALISAIEKLPDETIFIRNGSNHTTKEAADHLRFKYSKAKKKIKTAEDFIEYLASKSSISKKDYTIVFSDDATETSGAYLRTVLSTLK